ncbi:MAG TPA: hypothetical protein VHK69_20445 [Chitinophagaceae bacterium]|jgi:hypothetical protein|nr:hypothetical protein [Chitinophagaceae bacterium]
MCYRRLLSFLLLLLAGGTLSAQKSVVYSEPQREDSRRINFEVIGKVSGNFLVYKNLRNRSVIAIYDNDMKLIGQEVHEFIPEDRLINVDFFPYSDHSYMVYQYQKRNVVYCNAVKIDGMGKKISEVTELDTSHIGFATNNKIYSAISSEDKRQLMIFKINQRNRQRFLITSLLFDEELQLKKRSALAMPMEDRDDYLDEFTLDNEGDLVFTKFRRNTNETIAEASMIYKPAQEDSFYVSPLSTEQYKIFLDEPYIKVDNANKRYFLTSFYYKQRRGNIEGFYFYVWDKATRRPTLENTVVLGEDLRREAKGESNVRMAFNDYFIRNIIVKRDGGFIIGSEAYYTTSRAGGWNRWNYLYGMPMSAYDYYAYSPIYSNWWWRNRTFGAGAIRHHADNITILSFDAAGKLEWSNVIHKEQFDDESDDRISYQLVNTGGRLHFVFNQEEKRTQLLSDYTLTPGGEISRNPTLKNLDRNFEFLPKYGKQVSSKQLIIPCYYRNYICFAKVEFN